MDIPFLEELFAPFGEVTVRKMFGGMGVFHRGLSFAGVMKDEFRFKVDGENRGDFEAEGMKQWEYERKDGKIVAMGYWTVPERLLDDPDEFKVWAERAFEAAARADQAKPPKQRKLVNI
ncbi:MAG: TfoX/Sxy family protein [Rhizobiaceae bacterium]